MGQHQGTSKDQTAKLTNQFNKKTVVVALPTLKGATKAQQTAKELLKACFTLNTFDTMRHIYESIPKIGEILNKVGTPFPEDELDVDAFVLALDNHPATIYFYFSFKINRNNDRKECFGIFFQHHIIWLSFDVR
jgi:hypothetical protein